ncbi:hypothetical protein QTO19_17540 [Serratia marcescens]|uniref:HNH endonuclease n=1 Tax=Serratia marcescens TaxID=615 RepID=UPI00276DE58B|nr:hypothetical protein [Serratia marcescens]MDP8822011.1 hypothetical protein [Serratia marcescens]
MNRVIYPNIGCTDVFGTCLLSVSDSKQAYKDRLHSISGRVIREWGDFDTRCAPKNFHLFIPCEPRKPEQLIERNVTKKDLKELYTVYMLKADSEARKVYDKLRACSKGLCPLCGIYGVDTLDHYLPKARYPLLSVNPKNLIPACTHCNGVKSASICSTASEQTLYPYNDDSKFYQTDWVTATITAPYGILTFDFQATPPQEWLRVERDRVINHFITFGLRKKYALNAAQFVTTITSDIRRMLLDGDHITVQNHYAGLAVKQKENSTLRVVYNAIANDLNICGGRF